MKHLIRIVVGIAGVGLLTTLALGLEPPSLGTSVGCEVRAVQITKPAYMVVDAVIRGSRLLLPDYTNGLREIDLATGNDLRSVLPMGIKRGHVTGPQHLGCGDQRCVVYGDRYFWIYYDSSFGFVDEILGMDTGPGAQPLVFADRVVVVGTARAKFSAGGVPYLFVQYDDGAVVPLQEYPTSMAVPEIAKRIHFQGATAGGVDRLTDGGWLYVDPRNYGVFVFDEHDRLVRAWRGANTHFRPPNFAGYEPVHDASGREYYSRWSLAQTQVKRPVVLGPDLVGIVVGIPDGPFNQRHELDLYRLDGTPVATGVAIPGVTGGRVIVADAGRGNLVMVGQTSWEPGSETKAWTVSISGIDS